MNVIAIGAGVGSIPMSSGFSPSLKSSEIAASDIICSHVTPFSGVQCPFSKVSHTSGDRKRGGDI